MEDEYVIINKTAIQKRIEDLEKEVEFYSNVSALSFNPNKVKAETELSLLKQIISQSIPLIPEIDKAFDAGVDWQEGGTILYPDKYGYISNLKLDI